MLYSLWPYSVFYTSNKVKVRVCITMEEVRFYSYQWLQGDILFHLLQYGFQNMQILQHITGFQRMIRMLVRKSGTLLSFASCRSCFVSAQGSAVP